jgi:hypothetical protein
MEIDSDLGVEDIVREDKYSSLCQLAKGRLMQRVGEVPELCAKAELFRRLKLPRVSLAPSIDSNLLIYSS